MSSGFGPGEAAGPRLIGQMSTTSVTVGMALMERRSRALADYWRSFSAVRDPSDLFALQLGYWRQMMDDYSGAFTESMAPLKGEAEAAPEAPAQPSSDSRAA